jgi:hypothetical protein
MIFKEQEAAVWNDIFIHESILSITRSLRTKAQLANMTTTLSEPMDMGLSFSTMMAVIIEISMANTT